MRPITYRGRTAFLFTPNLGLVPSRPWIVIDAETGAILEARDRACFARASTFATNPTRHATPELLTLAVAPSATTLTSALLSVRTCNASREGACTYESLVSANANGDFVAAPTTKAPIARDPFAETSLYYHAARAIAFFGAPLRKAPLQLVAGAPMPLSVYLPVDETSELHDAYGGGTVVFGRSDFRDFAYDGDVVYHELTHAVLDATLRVGGFRISDRGISSEPDAIKEALADYFAAAISGDPFIGEWAFAEQGPRAIDNEDSCATSIVGRPHEDGLILSGALWETRAALPEAERPVFDRAVLASLTPRDRDDLGFHEIAQRILGHASPAAQTLLRAQLEQRGILPSCNPVRTLLPTQSVSGKSESFFAPAPFRIGAPVTPGVVDLRIDVPTGSTKMTLRFAGRTEGAFLGPSEGSFVPVILAAWDRPIHWARNGITLGHDAPVAIDPTLDGSYRATIAVAEGARVAHVQIGNRGQMDGGYDAITVAFESAPAPSPTSLEAGGSGCAVAHTPSIESAVALLALLFTLRRSRGDCRRCTPRSPTRPISDP